MLKFIVKIISNHFKVWVTLNLQLMIFWENNLVV